LTSETGTARVLPGPGVPAFEISDHNCFACGALNHHGLGLVLHVEPARCWTDVTLDRRFEGWDGVAHGGIVCTILDEVMAWALVGDDNWGVTARLAVDFRKPVRIGTEFRAEGWVARSRRRIVDTEARLVGHGGEVLATATATYVAADPGRRAELRARYGFRLVDGAPAEAPDQTDGRR
jgi:acyl-coenzyme A thioesterase PaaI-like protein